MRLAFADTFYWFALADYTDNSHQQALKLTAELATCKILTTDEVLTEYLNFFSKSIEPSRRQVMQSVRGILGSPSIVVVPQSRRSFLAACDRDEVRSDKGYSLTDCISMETNGAGGTKGHSHERFGISSKKVSASVPFLRVGLEQFEHLACSFCLFSPAITTALRPFLRPTKPPARFTRGWMHTYGH